MLRWMKVFFALTAVALGFGCGERAAAPKPAAPTAPAASVSDGAPLDAGPAAVASLLPPPVVHAPLPDPVPDAGGSLVVCDEQRTHVPCIYLSQGSCLVFRGANLGVASIECPTPLPAPVGDACSRAAQCVGVSDEGCCVGCTHPMQTRIPAACAKRIEAAKGCDAVRGVLRAKECTLH